MKLDDEESSLKWCKWWWSNGQENRLIFLVFKVYRGLEDKIISKVVLLMVLWEDKSKISLGPEIFLELEDERRMEVSNEESTLDLEEWDPNKVDYLAESELESFSLFLWR